MLTLSTRPGAMSRRPHLRPGEERRMRWSSCESSGCACTRSPCRIVLSVRPDRRFRGSCHPGPLALRGLLSRLAEPPGCPAAARHFGFRNNLLAIRQMPETTPHIHDEPSLQHTGCPLKLEWPNPGHVAPAPWDSRRHRRRESESNCIPVVGEQSRSPEKDILRESDENAADGSAYLFEAQMHRPRPAGDGATRAPPRHRHPPRRSTEPCVHRLKKICLLRTRNVFEERLGTESVRPKQLPRPHHMVFKCFSSRI